ncbi:MAG: hypothetical protein ACRDI2_12450, partial [Chloroflexota bacterium]
MSARERSAGGDRSRWPGWAAHFLLPAAILGASLAASPPAQEPPGGVVRVARISGVINVGASRYVDRTLDDAERQGVETVVLALDTSGGFEQPTRRIVQRLQRSSIPVVVYVAPAGAQA